MKNGIWKYTEKLKYVKEQFRCSMGEGNTPISKFLDTYIKREDLNPTGSYKDRGVAYRISVACQNGENKLVVTSTGNFAISMATYGEKFGVQIIVFIPKTISPEKEKLLNLTKAKVFKVDKPILQAKDYAKAHDIPYIRQSLDTNVLEGFKTLILEVLDNKIKFENIIFPASSGSLMLASYQVLNELNVDKFPRLIAVQTCYNTYIAREFYKGYVKSLNPSLATSLNVKLRPEKLDQVIHAIKKTNGTAFVVNEKDIKNTNDLLWKNNIKVGYESAAGFFAAKKLNLKGNTLVISTGVKR